MKQREGNALVAFWVTVLVFLIFTAGAFFGAVIQLMVGC